MSLLPRALAIRIHVRHQHHGLRALTIVHDRLLHRSLITAESPQRSSFDLGDKHCQATSRLTG